MFSNKQLNSPTGGPPCNPRAAAKVPAQTCQRMREAAAVESGETCKKPAPNHVARDAYRSIKRWGISWKIPFDVYLFKCKDSEYLEVQYMCPEKTLPYLAARHPRVVFGKPTVEEGMNSLRAFWEAYREYHGDHEVFSTHADLSRVIPVAIHGDEGKGKRRSNTTVVSFESVLGMKSKVKLCTTCCPTHLEVPTDFDFTDRRSKEDPLVKELFSNMQSHSYLQHWPMVVIPGTFASDYKELTLEILELFGSKFDNIFRAGFKVGDEQFYCAVVACKGDLRWYSKICRLTRGYENKGRVVDKPCCHQCLAGTTDLPAEDMSTTPVWLETLHLERPWKADKPHALHAAPYDPQRPEHMYRHDCFHTLRLGVFRDFTASALFLFIQWDLFGADGNLSLKLERAHGQFKLFLASVGKTASLRSFSTSLFQYKNKKSYPWSNVKGSDCTLLLKFVRVMTIALLNQVGGDQERRKVLNVLLSTARLGISVYDHMNAHRLFMDWACGAVFYEKGQAFCNGYGWLACWAFEHQLCLFAIKPKLHFWSHVLADVKGQLDRRCVAIANPIMTDCQQNEDFIGRLCKLSMGIDNRVVFHRTLEFYLTKAAILLRRHSL